ncbi:MAG: methyltransferase [Rhizonema sp. PD38]|nr:methyltransferase [Rhizonema sp. PD38]
MSETEFLNQIPQVSPQETLMQMMTSSVGGGHGYLLSSILKANPNLKGIVYDLPNVITTATFGIGQLERSANLDSTMQSGTLHPVCAIGAKAWGM